MAESLASRVTDLAKATASGKGGKKSSKKGSSSSSGSLDSEFALATQLGRLAALGKVEKNTTSTTTIKTRRKNKLSKDFLHAVRCLLA